MKTAAWICETVFSIDDAKDRDTIQTIYQDAFRDATQACIQEQSCHDADNLAAALLDPSYVKFVLRDGPDLQGFCLATNDLEKARIAYVNPVRLRHLLPEEASRDAIWYVTAIAIDPKRQGGNGSDFIYNEIARFMDARRAILAFDYAADKMPNFPKYSVHQFRKAQRALSLGCDVPSYEEFGGQTYGVIRFFGKKDP